MKQIFVPILAGLALAGCQHTVEGMSKDTKENSRQAAAEGAKAIEGATVASHNAEATVSLATPIKLAIDGDTTLNDPANSIDVAANEKAVIVTGHVKTKADREKVNTIAKKILQDHEAKQVLVDQLTVKPAG